MLKRFVKLVGGDPNQRRVNRLAGVIEGINALEPDFEALSDDELSQKTNEFRLRLALGEELDDILSEAFAAVREASKRTIGLRHYDIQLVGGITLHQGNIAEMRTGEGKTLVATLPLYLNALPMNPAWIKQAKKRWGDDPNGWQWQPINQLPISRGAHLVTVNDYLARRDARWKAPIYQMLGLSVGVLQMAARTDHGRLAYLIDLEINSPIEDQHQLARLPRGQAYAADITYGTTNEYGFDYLRDNMKMTMAERVQRGHHYAIIDEVDNVLVDEARTPLIISGPSHDDAENYLQMARVVKQLHNEDFEVDERSRSVALSEIGEIHVEQILGQTLRDPERPEDITPEQARLLGYLEQALRAQFVYRRNKEYLVQGGKVIIVDENTGRLMPGRRWSDGLHQAVEAKEGVKVESENVTYATITIQNYYRMYEKLSGMTGTASTEAEEFHKIYELDVIEIPTNLDYQSGRDDLPMEASQDTDDEGYKFTYYQPDGDDSVTFFKRKDYPDVIFRTEEAKFRAIGEELLRFHTMGRPILVGTTSVELSERISSRLKADPIRKLAQVILLRHAWMETNNREFDGRKVEELEFLNRPLGLLPAAQMRKVAREIDHNLNPMSDANLDELLDILRLGSEHKDRLGTVLKNGINHEVLNARKHTEESQIIADAGAFGAVTIATNMAGRGVDIKLGGELPEEVLSQVNRVLRRTGIEEPYDLTMDERLSAFEKLSAEDIGIYQADIEAFQQYMHDSGLVKQIGGLHVIGSERHDSRRIDNQLRGRSSRQGDPGSSRFYLSLQDDLMRLFGGAQAEGLMGRLNIDDDMPIEMGIVSRIVEQSQTRVEGANFDTRKHLLEYDDVLNKQRATIYDQRDKVMTKHDLSEDVNEMLEFEIRRRVPEALEDPEGPWRLLAWLGETQPSLFFGNAVYPSYAQNLIMKKLSPAMTDRESAEAAFLDLAEKSLDAEKEHVIDAVNSALENAEIWAETQYKDRSDTLDIFMEGLEMADETEARSPKELENELVALLRTPLRLNSDEQREIRRDPEAIGDLAEAKVESYLATNGVRRVVAVAERNLRESIDLVARDLTMEEFDAYGDKILEAVETVFKQRKDNLIGENRDGRIAKDIKSVLDEFKTLDEIALMNVLLRLPQGQRATFDRKTKQRVWTRTTRLTFRYHAAELMSEQEVDELTEDILKHLDNAQETQQRYLGAVQLNQFGSKNLSELPENLQESIEALLAEASTQLADGDKLSSLNAELAQQVASELGREVQTRTYRDLLLRVIGQLWIDYLTQMEALRVSVGLEAYGQRDPLVKYKSQASEFFQVLISDTRTGVVSRMFTFQPRMIGLDGAAEVAVNGSGNGQPSLSPEAPPPAALDAGQQAALDGGGRTSKKRRRRRKKK
jgi:preprotein translocase subunit SecA